MHDYARYFIERKVPEKRGVSINRDIDWWMGYLAGRMAKMLFIVLLAILFLVLQSFWQLGKSQERFPIENIQLQGNVLITRSGDIREALSDLNNKSFFSANLDEVAAKIEALPWINSAVIKRVWPNQLSIYIEEHQAVYRWGEDELVDVYGNRFFNTVPQLFARLPKIGGVAGHESEVIYAYQQLVSALGNRAERLGIKDFILNKYLSWELHLDSGLVVKFGRDNYQKRLKRFVMAYQSGKLPKLDELETLDFRYNKGFAVKWKAEFLPANKNKEHLVKTGVKKVKI